MVSNTLIQCLDTTIFKRDIISQHSKYQVLIFNFLRLPLPLKNLTSAVIKNLKLLQCISLLYPFPFLGYIFL